VTPTPTPIESARDRHLPGPQADRGPAKAQPGRAEGALAGVFRAEPPAYRRGFLVRGLAHRLQELTYGGLRPAYQTRLDAMIEGTEKPNGAGRPGRRPRHDVHLLEGTKLLREWRGVTHEVTVIDGGYEHQGKRYRSLSAIARAITGTQWSGPLFFGLRKTGSGR
jgi:Protein of unknown function (DUF2924)